MTVTPVDLNNRKILITGATGQVGLPLLAALAPVAEVFALARFADPGSREQVEALGVTALQADLADRAAIAALPNDFDYVVNLAVVKSGDFDYDLAANGEGVGNLMEHCRTAQAFLHISSTAVYEYAGHEPRAEDAPLGDNHRNMFPTYSIAKIAAETVCRYVARREGLPTTIARLSVPYGDNGGWMYYHLLMMQGAVPIDVHPEQPNTYNPLHMDDLVAKLPYLLASASNDVTTVNLGGSQAVSIEQWCDYLKELTGLEPVFKSNPAAFGSLQIDTTKMHELIGETAVDWRQGIHSMVTKMAPDLLLPEKA